MTPTSEVVARLEQAASHCAEQQAMHGNDIDGDSEPHWSSQLEMTAAEKACRDAIALISSLVAERDAAATKGHDAFKLGVFHQKRADEAEARALTAERLLAEARAALTDFVTNYADMQDGDGNEAPELARARASIGGGNG